MFEQNFRLILASKSPRRRELLSKAGFEFEIKTKDTPEDYPEDLPAEKVAEFLAKKKADAVQEWLTPDAIILTADSVVILDNQMYEKPQDRDDAVRILRALSGNVHQVITGVCLTSVNEQRLFSGVSKVHFETLNDTEIEYYIDAYQPYDKAGSYAIQEWVGLCKISKIEGTYANIMGLPVDLVYRHLEAMNQQMA